MAEAIVKINQEMWQMITHSSAGCTMVTYGILMLVGILFAFGLKKTWSGWKLRVMAEKIPGPPGYPFIGNALEFLGPPQEVFENVVKKGAIYKDVAKLWAGPRLFVFLSHPEDIELVLGSSEHLDKSKEYDYLKPWLGEGLLISSGEKWKAQRKIIAPTFHLPILKTFMEAFNKEAATLARRLSETASKRGSVDIHDFLGETTVQTLIRTVMGVQHQTSRNCSQYAKAVMDLCNLIHARQTKFWLRPEFVFSRSSYGKLQKKLLTIIHRLTDQVMESKIQELKKTAFRKEEPTKLSYESTHVDTTTDETVGFSFGKASGLKDDLDGENDIDEKKRMPFLETLLDRANSGGGLTKEEVKEQVNTIMFEGHDTTASCGSFFLCLMAEHPDIQETCVMELERIFGESKRSATFEDTLEMKYLERCLLETLRLYPPVPVIAREIKKELKLASKDLTIPANCTVNIGTFMLHRRNDIYSNPDKFDPDNFLPEKYLGRHPYSFIPFSAGPRSCVGRKYAILKLKVLLSTILRQFKVETDIKQSDWKLQGDIILKRADGFNLIFTPRC